ncbi:MAG: DEAD/DEAH box helicase family protein [Candidatus Chryseobacterium colombiense]|nr:DEAD/DEAH box helicase family protein [Chryseobacterium sp.]WEK69471.1 MAG: DEAD/DEAH box helicase family protein [Chryseobacterium sp.]
MYKKLLTVENTPIQYKEIRPTDFEGYNISDEDLIIIKEDEKGYISDFLGSNIDLSIKDTTVINASVGQGKTTALVDMVKRYHQDNNYMVLLVSPFKSLLDQYYSSLLSKGIPYKDIFDYRALEDENFDDENSDPINRRIQLITFNFLLGNSGETYLKQSSKKTEFIDEILGKCKEENRKVVLIFDEVHDAIHNFKEELVFNLFRWRKYVHKIFVSSATYNEASKVVIKYFAELTDRKIKIFESLRKQDEDNLSELNVMIYDHSTYDVDNINLINLFRSEIGKASKINILTYTKALTDRLSKSIIGKEIRKSYGDINICTSDTGNIFDDSKCNMGTNFKTGISINKKDTAYFIFLPQKRSYEKLPGELGVFTEGINTLIQALARPREKARIYVITPNVTSVLVTSNDPIPKSNAIININKQDRLLRLFYDQTKEKLKEEIGYFEDGHTLINARFPDYDQFKLSQGEKYFRVYFDAFGKNLSNYFNWAARNNQFVNCKLKYLFKLDLEIEEGKMLQGIKDYFNSAFYESEMFRYLSPSEQYQQLRESIFSNYVTIKSKDNSIKELKPYGKVEFEKNIIKFIQQYNSPIPYLEDYLGINYENYVDTMSHKETIDTIEKLEPHKKTALLNYKHYKQDDYVISTEEYIRSSMYFAKNTSLKTETISKNEDSLIYLYSKLYDFKDTLTSYLKSNANGQVILPQDKDFKFNSTDFSYLESLIDRLKQHDPTLKNVFNFMQTGISEKKVYSLLKKLYFETDRTSINSGSGKQTYIKRDITDDEHGKTNLIYKHIDFVSLVKSYQEEYTKEYLEAKED